LPLDSSGVTEYLRNPIKPCKIGLSEKENINTYYNTQRDVLVERIYKVSGIFIFIFSEPFVYFRRMVILGILERIVYPEVPPHVEYRLTDFGLRFMPILDSIEELQHELEAHSNSKVADSQTAV
jgi:HxlR-like helix-turn-helix